MTGKSPHVPHAKDARLWPSLKRYLWTGVAVIFPLYITVYLIILIFQFIDGVAGKYVNSILYDQFGYKVPGLGFLITFLAVLAVGFLSRNFLGKWFFARVEGMLRRIPLVANIYSPAKQLADFLFTDEKKERFEKVVLVEFPVKDSYSLGFITNEHLKDFEVPDQKEKNVCVFVPLAPAPFSGLILIVPKDKIRELDISVDRAIKFVVSGGVVLE